MGFMEPEIIQGCARVEDSKGETCIVPLDCIPDDEPIVTEGYTFYPPFTVETFPDSFAARYSAPGYLDCTDWSGPYDTEEEAEKDIHMYGEEEEDDGEEDDE